MLSRSGATGLTVFSLHASLGRRLQRPAFGWCGEFIGRFLLDFSPQNNLNSFPTKRMSVVWYSKDYARRNLRFPWSVEGCISMFLTDLFRR